MKKLLILVMILFTLCGCTDDGPISNPASEVSSFEVMDTVQDYLEENYNLNRDYYLGSGIRTLSFDSDKICEGNSDVFPVYFNDRILFMVVLKDGTSEVILPEKTMEKMSEDDHFILYEIENEILYISETENISLYTDESSVLPEEIQKVITKNFEGKITENPMGTRKIIIKTVKPSGGKDGQSLDYAHDHIIIRFAQGDREKQISDYEAFCNGKVGNDDPDLETYIFYFDPLSDTEMDKLVDLSNQLPYVESAAKDKVADLIDPTTVDQ